MHFNKSFIILSTFIKSWMVVLIKIIRILIMSAKFAIPGVLMITVYWNKCYDVIISIHDLTKKNFLCSCGQSLATPAFKLS